MVPPAANVAVLLVLLMRKSADAVTAADAVATLLLGTESGSGVTPLGEFNARRTLAVLINEVEVGVAAVNTLTVNDSVCVVSGKMALIVQVPVLPEVAKLPAVALGAGLAANAKVGGNTSRYCTWKAARGPLLRAVIVNVPVEPTNVGVFTEIGRASCRERVLMPV